MVVWLTPKVKQGVLTAVCRRAPTLPSPASEGGFLLQWVSALDPGCGAAVDVADRGVAELLQVAGRRQAALTAVADGEHLAISGDFGNPLLELAQRNELRARHMSRQILPGLADIEQVGPRSVGLEATSELLDVDG